MNAEKTFVDTERSGQFDYIKQDLSIVHQKLDEHSEHLRLLVQPISDLAVTTQFSSPRLQERRG